MPPLSLTDGGFSACYSAASSAGAFVAANGAAALATGSLALAGGLGVNLLSLALFETFGHGGAYGVEDQLD